MRRLRIAIACVWLPATTLGWLGCIVLKVDGMATATADATGEGAVAGEGSVDGPGSDGTAPFDAADTDGTAAEAAPADGAGSDVGDAPADGGLPQGGPWPADVPVCWQSVADEAAFTAPADGQVHWIHDAVESNWGREANVRFGTWPLCPTSGSTVNARIVIIPPDGADAGQGDAGNDETDAAVAEWGGRVDGTGTASGSNPTEQAKIAFWPLEPDGVDDAPRELAICAAGRLFSRVLGLADDPAAQPLGAAVCGDVSNPTGGRLSPLQIFRARRAYGGKPAGSIVGFDGRCLSAQSTTSGAVVWTDQCVAAAGGVASSTQRWVYDPWKGSVTLTESGLALDSHGGAQAQQATVGDAIVDSPDQFWPTTAAALRGIGGTCVDFQQTSGGPRTVLWPCQRSVTTQRVEFGPGASIQATVSIGDGSATCLGVSDTQVVPVACDGTPSQGWTLAPGGAVQWLGATGGCLEAAVNVVNPETGLEDGLALHVATCSGATEQQFDILGVLLASTMCLDVAGIGRADQTPVWLWPCADNGGLLGAENDWWDVTW